MNEEVLEKLKEVGIESEEVKKVWEDFKQQAIKEGNPEEKAERLADSRTRTYYKKVLKKPTKLYEDQVFIGATNLTDWAEIGRNSSKQNKAIPKEQMQYVSGLNVGKAIPKNSMKKTYYFMNTDGEVYPVSSALEIEWNTLNPEDEAKEKETFFPTLDAGKRYKFRVAENTLNDGRVFRNVASFTRFVITGTTTEEEILAKFRTLSLAEVSNSPEVPDTFVIDVDVLDITEQSSQTDILVEDESVRDNFKEAYNVYFDKGIFKVPVEGHAKIIVKTKRNKQGEFTGFEGLSYFSKDIVETAEISPEDWTEGGDNGSS